ncbi:hypothetical protein GCM10017653_47270 [Ancylobacter defluvii]|uniref:Uncharacterized protein n=1 Tax=Ancylobacter defluvii TaxID=1282440 RepID=A0A9W6K0Q7_9HYPH|nr:hypothetical protein GCM10017653_47270 [Ancylobacter defluvii]
MFLGASLLATLCDDPVKWTAAKDDRAAWLGFWGGFSGGLMTLVAAAVAWLGVQRQINESRSAEVRQRHHAAQLQRCYVWQLKQTSERFYEDTLPMMVNSEVSREDYSRLDLTLMELVGLPPLAPIGKDVEITFSVTPYEIISALRACIITDEELQLAIQAVAGAPSATRPEEAIDRLHAAAFRAETCSSVAWRYFEEEGRAHHSAVSG